MGAGQIGSWQSPEYVGQWAGEDVVARLLETPRQVSIALVRDAGIEVSHVVDLGSGEGPYLADFLRTFGAARGTWFDSSEPMLERAREALAEFGDRDWEQRYRRIRDQFTGARRRTLQPHREDEPLQPAADHLRYLEQAGFAAVDVPWRMLYTALLAARAS